MDIRPIQGGWGGDGKKRKREEEQERAKRQRESKRRRGEERDSGQVRLQGGYYADVGGKTVGGRVEKRDREKKKERESNGYTLELF